jgi:Cu+-exporting ATPase
MATSESITLPVLGMSCASCQQHVESALRATSGVESARVDLMTHRASVVFDPAVVAPAQLVEAIRASGYDAVLPRPGAEAEAASDGASSMERKAYATLIAGAAAMLLAMPLGSEMGALDHALMRLLPWLFALPPNPLRWFLLLLTAGMMVWAGPRHLSERRARIAPWNHQHEHTGQPGNGRGLSLFRSGHYLARC